MTSTGRLTQRLYRLLALFRSFTGDAGQDLVEYTLLLAFIGLCAVAFFMQISNSVSAVWNTAQSHLDKGHHYAKGKDK